MIDNREQRRIAALEEFRRARRRAIIEDLLAWVTGEPDDLLNFEEVRQRIGAQGWAVRGLREIPLEKVVGSLGRYHDFTRHFLPRNQSDETRWAGVRAAFAEGRRLPPIEVYALGGLYFVKDGNHRVSVARELGMTHILAQVTELNTRVELDPDVGPDELIIAAEYAGLIEETRLDRWRPGLDLRVTAPGAYPILATHIEQQRYRMALELGRAVTSPEAAERWYDEIYQPVVELIHERGLLHDFPERTETDLYVWVARHQADLEASLGWPVDPEAAVADLAHQRSRRPERVLARARERLIETIVPTVVRTGPPPGAWRRKHLPELDEDEPSPSGLFHTLLVPFSGDEASWVALNQALIVAHREGGVIHGLHVQTPEADPEDLLLLQANFAAHCAAEGIVGRLASTTGGVAAQICDRARWADLVVVRVSHPPAPRPIARLRSGLRDLIERCPQPVLAVPGEPSPLNRGLLAYDGSPRAHEALMLAAYLALRDDLSLVVVTAAEHGDDLQLTIGRAQSYLEDRGIQAGYVIDRRPAHQAIMAAAAEHGSNLIIIGGYGSSPALEIALGGTVDHVLRASHLPVLVCR